MITTHSEPGHSEETVPRLGHVELELPARGDLLFLARMTAAAVASRAEFGYEQVEDVRLALDELCLALLEKTPEDSRIALTFGWTEDSIEITASTDHCGSRTSESSAEVPKPNELAERILDALVDSHGFEVVGEKTTSWLRMKRAETAE